MVTGVVSLVNGGILRLKEEGIWRKDKLRKSELGDHPPVGAIECPQ